MRPWAGKVSDVTSSLDSEPHLQRGVKVSVVDKPIRSRTSQEVCQQSTVQLGSTSIGTRRFNTRRFNTRLFGINPQDRLPPQRGRGCASNEAGMGGHRIVQSRFDCEFPPS